MSFRGSSRGTRHVRTSRSSALVALAAQTAKAGGRARDGLTAETHRRRPTALLPPDLHPLCLAAPMPPKQKKRVSFSSGVDMPDDLLHAPAVYRHPDPLLRRCVRLEPSLAA
jgi:hypothetical protein